MPTQPKAVVVWTLTQRAECRFKSSLVSVCLLAAVRCTSAGAASAGAGDCAAVLTPGGPAGKSCVHEVPDGALVEIDDAGVTSVSLNGKVVATYPPCKCSRPLAGQFGAALPPLAADSSSNPGTMTVACGKLDGDEPCCSTAWKEDGPCSADVDQTGCWTACLPSGDGGHWRSQMTCGADGRVSTGHGLFPCDVNP